MQVLLNGILMVFKKRHDYSLCIKEPQSSFHFPFRFYFFLGLASSQAMTYMNYLGWTESSSRQDSEIKTKMMSWIRTMFLKKRVFSFCFIMIWLKYSVFNICGTATVTPKAHEFYVLGDKHLTCILLLFFINFIKLRVVLPQF